MFSLCLYPVLSFSLQYLLLSRSFWFSRSPAYRFSLSGTVLFITSLFIYTVMYYKVIHPVHSHLDSPCVYIRPVTRFQVIFVRQLCWGSLVLPVSVQSSQHHLLQRLSFSAALSGSVWLRFWLPAHLHWPACPLPHQHRAVLPTSVLQPCSFSVLCWLFWAAMIFCAWRISPCPSLVVQRLRICFPAQAMWFCPWSGDEDSPCLGAARPGCPSRTAGIRNTHTSAAKGETSSLQTLLVKHQFFNMADAVIFWNSSLTCYSAQVPRLFSHCSEGHIQSPELGCFPGFECLSPRSAGLMLLRLFQVLFTYNLPNKGPVVILFAISASPPLLSFKLYTLSLSQPALFSITVITFKTLCTYLFVMFILSFILSLC